MNMADQEYCLRWNNHESNICSVLESMLKRGILVDVTLSCEGRNLRVHRAVLSACSPYFENLFTETEHPHPIIILKDVKGEELQALVDYMYTGQVTVNRSNLKSFLKVAESLKIRGLVNHALKIQNHPENSSGGSLSPDPDSCVPLRKRKRRLTTEYNHVDTYIPNEMSSDDTMIPYPPSEGPTDLSLPKLEAANQFFQPVIQTVSYSAVDPTNANHSNQVYLKPKEALISPPLSEASEGSSSGLLLPNNERDVYVPLLNNQEMFHGNGNGIRHEQQQIFSERTLESASSSHRNSQSDDEDIDHYNQESEVGAPMVRSGICTVCGCFRSDLRQHMDSHSGQSFRCDTCGRTYPRRKTLNQHIKRSHPGLIPDSSAALVQ